MIPEALEDGFTKDEFHFYIRDRLLGIWSAQMDNKTEEDAFQGLIWNYTPWPYLENKYENREVTNKVYETIGNTHEFIHGYCGVKPLCP